MIGCPGIQSYLRDRCPLSATSFVAAHRPSLLTKLPRLSICLQVLGFLMLQPGLIELSEVEFHNFLYQGMQGALVVLQLSDVYDVFLFEISQD